mmetsp:Transcript_34855/g.86495  ORF Transcript_34855/g.86495 Transcript_34855/m.86495 type:complete len:549 (+) Transcript_34855:1360-3006(+)
MSVMRGRMRRHNRGEKHSRNSHRAGRQDVQTAGSHTRTWASNGRIYKSKKASLSLSLGVALHCVAWAVALSLTHRQTQTYRHTDTDTGIDVEKETALHGETEPKIIEREEKTKDDVHTRRHCSSYRSSHPSKCAVDVCVCVWGVWCSHGRRIQHRRGEAQPLSHPLAVLGISAGEDLHLTLLDLSLGVLEVGDDVVNQMVAVLAGHHFAIEVAGLLEVAVGVHLRVSAHNAADGLARHGETLVLHRSAINAVRLIVGRAALVAIDTHRAVTGVVVVPRAVPRTVDRDLVVVGTESVSVSVRVGEEPPLQHLVFAGLDARHQVGGRKGRLLGVLEVVLGVAVEDELADGDQGVVAVRPHLGDVEDVPLVGGGLPLRHDLHEHRPRRELTILDAVVEVPCGIVGIAPCQRPGLLSREVLDPLVSLEVHLDIGHLAVLVDKLERVGAIAVHVSVAVGRAAVAEEDRHLVDALGNQRQEIPEHVRVRNVGHGAALLRVDEVGELDGVANEEDRRVVPHHVPVALLGVELDREAAGVASSVSASPLAAHSRET